MPCRNRFFQLRNRRFNVKTVLNKKMSLIPSVQRMAELFPSVTFSHDILVRIIRQETVRLKKRIHAITIKSREEAEKILFDEITLRLESLTRSSLRRVINGTGIILHTGLGRASFSDSAKNHLAEAIENYCNIELDLESGERGDRIKHIEELLCLVTGAEAAVIVNNNAAAVLLLLNTLAYQKEVIISRGELVEIGGSFRIPDVMEKSGAIMREVGTTNKTHLKDFEKAVSKKTGLLMTVHTSNFRVVGFTRSVGLSELCALGKKRKLPTAYDLGGGAMIDLGKFGLPHEPVVSESLAAGADVVTFSADKILGGCQAGLLVGKKKYIKLIQNNPLMRALRCDKMTYGVLEATLKQFLQPDRLRSVSPVLAMLTEDIQAVQNRANRMGDALRNASDVRVSVGPSSAEAGSGTLPLEKIPSYRVTITSDRFSAKEMATKFRLAEPFPVVGFVKDNAFHLDMRTVRNDEVDHVIGSLKKIMNE
jgi:L-seryl-tRNA(Ser) seleniumtransferase